MKLKASILSVILCCLVFQMNAQDRETKTYTIEDLKSIVLSGNIEMHIKQGNSKTVKIEASNKQHEKMEVDIQNQVLSIASKGGKRNSESIEVYVEVEKLNDLVASGGADIYFENTIQTNTLNIVLSGGCDLSGAVDTERLSCVMSGGSDINLEKLETTKIQVTSSGGSDFTANDVQTKDANFVISGSSDINIVGSCDDMKIVASGSSDFMGDKFETQKLSIVISGASDANVHVTEELSIVAGGSSDVTCTGNPTIKGKEVSRGSDFIMQ